MQTGTRYTHRVLARLASFSIVTAAWALLLSCSDADRFACESDDQCRTSTQIGTCEAAGVCSFPDLGCQPSGRRYGEYAGSLSGLCVETQTASGTAQASSDDGRGETSTSQGATSRGSADGTSTSAGSSSTGVGATTGAASEDTGVVGSSTAGSTADPSQGPYGPCMDETCAEAEETCVMPIAGGSWCAQRGCDILKIDECPVPETGSPTIGCFSQSGGDPYCALFCRDMEAPCPDGMTCQSGRCVWL